MRSGEPNGKANGLAGLPIQSRLFKSLERGRLEREFSQLEHLGQGAFGTVLKGYNNEDNQAYALKLVTLQMREDDTVDDNDGVWCGPKVFRLLQRSRSKHLLRYYKYWTELPEDMPGSEKPRQSAEIENTMVRRHSSTRLKMMGGEDVTGSKGCDNIDEMSNGSFAVGASSTCSGDGFDWEPSSGTAEENFSSDDNVESPKRKRFGKDRKNKFDVVLVIQMEYVDGIELSTWLADPSKRNAMGMGGSFDEAVEVFGQLMEGLAELHMLGTVHRDVKPANLILAKKGGVLKIIDFGLARPKESNVSKVSVWGRQLSDDPEALITVIGTPGYAPPEQCSQPSPTTRRQLAADAAADVFSAGVVFVELLMAAARGGPPWRTSMERAEVFNKARGGFNAGLPDLLTKERPVPGWLRLLIGRMTKVDAPARPTAREVLEELRAGSLARERHNPFVGLARHAPSPQLEKLGKAPCMAQNPHVGFFLEHRSRTFEVAV